LETEFRVVSRFIARWALPNEGIPLFLLWEGKLDFDAIEIEKPESFIIRDYYNVAKVQPDRKRVRVDELRKEGYVGFVFTSPLFEPTSQEVEIVLNFLRKEKVVHREEFKTRIIRPKIELQVPDKVEVGPNGQIRADVKLKYTGYGNIYGKIIASNDINRLVFDVKDFRDLFIVMANARSFKHFMKRNQISEEEFLGSEIPEDQYDYRQLLLSTTQLGEFTAEAFFDTITRIMENRKMMEILEKSIEETRDVTTSFFKSIIDFVEKRPVEGVFLSETEIEPIELDAGDRTLFMCIGYVDDFGNYYSQIKKIPIVLQEKSRIMFDQKWDEQAGDWEWLKKK
jgi:hypothetical protein